MRQKGTERKNCKERERGQGHGGREKERRERNWKEG